MTRGIVGYGVHVPYHRLQRSAINAALGSGGGRGTRSVASYDEDATSMAVEASRNMLRSSDLPSPAVVTFSSATPPYLDKTNANAIHAALDLPATVMATDMAGSARSIHGALHSALHDSRPVLATVGEVRTGRPGSGDESNLGDAAVSLMIGTDDDAPVLAEWLGGASATGEFLDRWRQPGWDYSRVWEERFGEAAYAPLVSEAVTAAFKNTELAAADIDLAIITGLHARAVRSTPGTADLSAVPMAEDLTASIGNTGSAHSLLSLCNVLDSATPGQVVMLVNLADGCDVTVFRVTDAITSHQSHAPVSEQIAAGNDALAYTTFLTWRGFLDREPPRRPDPASPAAPPSQRSVGWKYALKASRDESTGAVHMPPQRVSVKGGAVDEMEPVSMANVAGTVATFTIDRLAYSPSPPTIAVVIDFDGGGRFTSQLTDADASEVAIGMRVTMTFRRMLTANGIHNYFWKATPLRS